MTEKEYFKRGREKYELGDCVGAEEDRKKAIKLDPSYKDIDFSKLPETINSPNFAKAIKDYNKKIELNFKDADAYYFRGAAKHKRGDYTGAIEDLNKAIELDPEDALSYFTRGLVKNELGDKAGTLEDLSKAGELGLTRAYENLSLIHI